MNSIIKNYNLLVKRYQKIEGDSTEKEIHDKRVILRRIFPILAVCKMDSSKISNGLFSFSGKAPVPAFCYLGIVNQGQKEFRRGLSAVNGQISIAGKNDSVANAVVTGSASHQE